MLQKKYRLRTFKDFKKVFAFGGFVKDSANSYIVARVVKNKLLFSRFAFVVSNKVSKSAVKRNKVKRRMREAARLKIAFIKSGYDIVFIANPSIMKKDFYEISEAVEKLLIKSNLLIAWAVFLKK